MSALDRHFDRIAERLPHVREWWDNSHTSTSIVWDVDPASPDADLIRADAQEHGLVCRASRLGMRAIIVEEEEVKRMRRCLICGSSDVVTPLLGMMALELCPDHREIVAGAHRKARDDAEALGQPIPMLTADFAIEAVPKQDGRASSVLVAFLLNWLNGSQGRSMPTWDSLAADDDETTLADAVRAAAEELGLAN